MFVLFKRDEEEAGEFVSSLPGSLTVVIAVLLLTYNYSEYVNLHS